MAAAIKEGLICAECHAEFYSVPVLLDHYRNTHEDNNSFKGLIDKAKSKLINKQQAIIRQEEVIRTTPKYFDIFERVSLGVTTNHFDEFKRIRTLQVDRHSSEASMLLIRLHKIISFVGDESKRRGFEQNLVQWMEEKHVTRCPDCTESFNLLLRKHHCRLCGSILCDHCSWFINGELAASLTSQLGTHDSIPKEYQLRTCRYCFELVKRKGTMYDTNPPIIQLYEKLKQLISQCEGLSSEYSTMVQSVGSGDNLYSMENVTQLRNNLIQHTEKIDMLSKRIVLLGVENNETISQSENRLRSRLRMSTINWIRDFLSGLSSVPEKAGGDGDASSSHRDGWTPSVDSDSVSNISESDEDVVAMQIERTRNWIAEAKRANRPDEVEMLQANLEELLKFKSETYRS